MAMFDTIKTTMNNPGVEEPSVPEGVRLYVIGDIHGRMDLLREVHEKIAADKADAPAGRLTVGEIYLGDYIDRGPNVKEVIEWLLTSPRRGSRRVFLKGNHEATLLNFMRNPVILDTWLAYGGVETLHSYGVDLALLREPGGRKEIHRRFIANLPAAHRQFLDDLLVSVIIGDYMFVHAGVRPGVAIKHQEEQDLLWIREEFLQSRQPHGKIIVHGHSPVPEPEILPNRLNIDTGAYATGRLTCLVLEADQQRFI